MMGLRQWVEMNRGLINTHIRSGPALDIFWGEPWVAADGACFGWPDEWRLRYVYYAGSGLKPKALADGVRWPSAFEGVGH